VEIRAIDEFNEAGHLIYAENFIGAFVRGRTRQEALAKFPTEILQYLRWCGETADFSSCRIRMVQEKKSTLSVQDADSDVLFSSESLPLSTSEYEAQKALALKSAQDFLTLYTSVPNQTETVLPMRNTFYGLVPRTADEMYRHTKNVNSYYFGEIGIFARNDPDIVTCRKQAFLALESEKGYLQNMVFAGSDGEQ
jgi:hypothetical protein